MLKLLFIRLLSKLKLYNRLQSCLALTLCLTFAGDHGPDLQKCDDQSGGDEQIPENALRTGLQLQDGADLQGIQYASL